MQGLAGQTKQAEQFSGRVLSQSSCTFDIIKDIKAALEVLTRVDSVVTMQ